MGAWKDPPDYRVKSPLLGAQPGRVRHAIENLQRTLEWNGYDLPRWGADGRYGSECRSVVRQFQVDKGIEGWVKQHELTWRGLGIVTRATAEKLYMPLIRRLEVQLAIPDFVFGGEVSLESGFDPGAIREDDDPQMIDRGIVQANVRWNPTISDELAYGRPWFMLNWAARKWASFRDTYGSEIGAILNHNNPAAAIELSRTDKFPEGYRIEIGGEEVNGYEFYVHAVIIQAGKLAKRHRG